MNLSKLFGSRLRAKVLAWFFVRADESFSVRQLAIILGEDPTNLSRELRRMEALGILKLSPVKNLKTYAVNEKSPFYGELKSLVIKTVGLAGRLRSALESVSSISAAFIYGSFAVGRENSESDVDLFIVGKADLGALDSALAEVEKEMGRTINYVVYNQEEFQAKKRAGDGFIRDVLKGEKLWLIGDDAGLKKT